MTEASYVTEDLVAIWLLLAFACCVSYIIQRSHLTILPPSGAATLVGIAFGGVLRLTMGQQLSTRFEPYTFFYALLPPIIYNAGLRLQKKGFFINFTSIIAFAGLGTIISTVVFGFLTYALVKTGFIHRDMLGKQPLLECLMYGSLVSAIDPVGTLSIFADLSVPPMLYSLVFGESVLNDAVAIVLFRTLESFYYKDRFTSATLLLVLLKFAWVSLGSIGIGIASGLLTAFMLKHLGLKTFDCDRASPSFDPTVYSFTIIALGAYLAYILAEMCGLSGIFAVFFCGICHSHYALYNVSEEAGTTVHKTAESVAFLSETFVYAYLGLQVFTFSHQVDYGLIFSAVPLCLLSRALNIFPISRILNMKRRVPIPFNIQVMSFACGLRGAIAYALSLNLPNAKPDDDYDGIPVMETSTLFLVILSTLLFGGMTGPMLEMLELKGATDREAVGDEQHAAEYERMEASFEGRIERMHSTGFHSRFRDFDRNVMRPVFGGHDGGAGGAGPLPRDVVPGGGDAAYEPPQVMLEDLTLEEGPPEIG
mmetsp:Transcript_28535/g.93243  ORF Transcript_28535/g.93243 Transcript_28535/m.93243 type:complete len:537 (-) Transcript_28535:999-2609(-)|eukprot:CAMPEP_0170156082 /NCGR_PEP_ID=MMETSP0033_2-20121228/62283_1 /TAXON_ID=195969 /ORGANISM="Dolichomastix tenuilepis, Strain CCMP3274" /LENGTH=536 /DNA_ID=CAMNT_0010393423 /DNA_START=52 /DNA_END=1662 /DNA_ORIENTATION=+